MIMHTHAKFCEQTNVGKCDTPTEFNRVVNQNPCLPSFKQQRMTKLILKNLKNLQQQMQVNKGASL
jgi:hypothetical protein